MLQSTLMLENLPINVQTYEPVSRFLDDWIPNTDIHLDALNYMLQSTLQLENLPIYVQTYEPVLRFLDDWIPNTGLLFRCLILNVAIKFTARKFVKKCADIWACIKISRWLNT